jgi:hypothetical protein
MSNVAHANMSGSNVHEPKGIETATSGQAYLADGLASGAWTTISGLSLTGAIAPWLTPIAPSGWYELNGATISSSSDSALYNVMTIQQSGTRVSGAATISGLSTLNTTNFKVGYYVFGTGIPLGTTIVSIDSPTDITMTATATSSGSSTVIVSPWQLTAGGIVLPDLTTSGLYLRSRTTSFQIGQRQTSKNLDHTHPLSVNAAGAHIHTGNTDTDGSHTHTLGGTVGSLQAGADTLGGSSPVFTGTASATTTGSTHSHHFTTGQADYGGAVTTHIHTGTATTSTDATSTSEVRPETLVVMWCVKR